MKLTLSLIACAVLCLPAAALAAPQDDSVVNVSGAKGVRGIHMPIDEYRQFKGAYSLSNGSVLRLGGTSRNMEVQIDDQPVHRMVATSHNSFVAVGHPLSLTLDVSQPGEPTGELVYLDESRRGLADIQEPMVHVAMR